ncbi:hypothetical protein TRVL_05831 [Trypanosoma vivax]|nr:hypothetical protein TRVL_05831 [Trypanosoma vivax]
MRGWAALCETQLPSTLAIVRWLCRILQREHAGAIRVTIPEEVDVREFGSPEGYNGRGTQAKRKNVACNAQESSCVKELCHQAPGTVDYLLLSLTDTVSRLSVRDVLLRIKRAPPSSISQPERVSKVKDGKEASQAVDAVVGRLPANEKTNYGMERLGEESSGECNLMDEICCETVEMLWVLSRLAVLVRQAIALVEEQLAPPCSSSGHLVQCYTNCVAGRGDSSDRKLGRNTCRDPGSVVYFHDDFPHECQVLVPLELCRTAVGMSLRRVIALSNRIAAHMRASKTSNDLVNTIKGASCDMYSSKGNDHGTEAPYHDCPSLSLVINPAVRCADNPHRAAKNRRLDKIQQALLTQYYESMVGSQLHSRNASTPSQQASLASHAVRGSSNCAKETASSLIRDASISLDIQLMGLSGGAVGYYLAHMRGLSTEKCVLSAAFGLLVMLLVDAFLLLLFIRRHDRKLEREQRRLQRSLWSRTTEETPPARGRRTNDMCGAELKAKKNA